MRTHPTSGLPLKGLRGPLCLSKSHSPSLRSSFFKGQDRERKLGAESVKKAAPDPTVGRPTGGDAAVTGRTPGSEGVSKPHTDRGAQSAV